MDITSRLIWFSSTSTRIFNAVMLSCLSFVPLSAFGASPAISARECCFSAFSALLTLFRRCAGSYRHIRSASRFFHSYRSSSAKTHTFTGACSVLLSLFFFRSLLSCSPSKISGATEDLTNRWSQPLAAPLLHIQMIPTLQAQFELVLASGGSALSR